MIYYVNENTSSDYKRSIKNAILIHVEKGCMEKELGTRQLSCEGNNNGCTNEQVTGIRNTRLHYQNVESRYMWATPKGFL